MNNEYKIFNLNKFRKIKNNSYTDKSECLKYSKKYGDQYITNPRFKKFDQTYFYAGDDKDIIKYGLVPLRYVYSETINNDKLVKNTNKDENEKIFKLYKNIDYHSVENTFNYMFNKFKKGIFVIIHNNKLILFLPFSNSNYKNNWVKQTYFSEDEKKMLQEEDYHKIKNKLNQSINDFLKKHPSQHKMNYNRERWYANNCIFRNKFPEYEGEQNVNVYKDLLETLLKERDIPDIEFFINDRDFPILKKDYTEPYDDLFDSDSVKIEEEYQFKKMCPIFSKSITDKFADILIPTNDDWTMASDKYFTSSCSDTYHKSTWDKINKDWKKKIPKCVFRGSATGCGITLETNMRLKAADISIDHPQLLDASITDWKARIRKYKGEPINVIDPQKFRFKLSDKEMNNIEKSNHKYILNIDGYVSAFRLSSELSMNSVIILVKSDYKLWFSDMLVEYIHYIPVDSNLDNLIDQIKWCIENDKKCMQIAKNAMEFHKKYLSKDGILDYIQNRLTTIHMNRNFKNLLDIKRTKNKIAIISCFRDKGNGERERERKIFVKLLNRLLYPYCYFKIYIIEQSEDGEAFNIGKLKNIGFEIANKEESFDNYIFSDIDTIPDYNIMNIMMKKYKYPVCLAIRGTRYSNKNEKIKKPFLGALIQMNEKIFKKINGYPNNFWGWGGEDDSLINRFLVNKINKIYYPSEGSIIDFEENKDMRTINNIEEKYKSEIKNMSKYEKLYEDLKSWNNNGINTLQYKIINKLNITENIIQIKVDLLKKKDESKYMEWFPNNSKNYSFIKREYQKNKLNWQKLNIEYI